MADAELGWDQIDCLISCSTSQFRLIPCNAAHFLQAIGEPARGLAGFDVQSTCLGSLVSLWVANGLLASSYRRVLIVAAESAMGAINWQQAESASLIGDGAAALIVERDESTNNRGIPLQYRHEVYAEHLELCKVDGGGHRLPVFDYDEQRRGEYLFDMDGPQVFRVAVRHLLPMVERLIEQWEQAGPGLDRASLHFIPHQASPKALELVRRGLQVPEGRFHTAVDEVGNMAAASIPWMIHRVLSSGACQRGDNVVLLGTSAGYAQAAMILQL